MTANTATTTVTKSNIAHETSTFALGLGLAATACVGIWASICLVSALVNNGATEVAKGLLGAIVG